MRIRFCISLSLLVMFASYGCKGSSETEMTQAQEAMDQAKSVHADDLAPADFEQAQKAWTHAQAAAKEGKTGTAKVLFASAKIFFHKAATIAKSRRDALSRELSGMELMISSDFDKIKSDISKNSLPPKLQGQVEEIASEVVEGNASIRKLVNKEDFLEAVATAKDVQKKIYNAQLILAGQRPEY